MFRCIIFSHFSLFMFNKIKQLYRKISHNFSHCEIMFESKDTVSFYVSGLPFVKKSKIEDFVSEIELIKALKPNDAKKLGYICGLNKSVKITQFPKDEGLYESHLISFILSDNSFHFSKNKTVYKAHVRDIYRSTFLNTFSPIDIFRIGFQFGRFEMIESLFREDLLINESSDKVIKVDFSNRQRTTSDESLVKRENKI